MYQALCCHSWNDFISRREAVLANLVVVAFSLQARILFESLTNHSLSVLFCMFCFLKWRSACLHLFHSLGQDQFTVAQ